MSWVTSSFGDCASDKLSPASNSQLTDKKLGLKSTAGDAQKRKRPRETSHRVQKQIYCEPGTDLWSDKYRPKTRAELAVHKKKVDEVADWLLQNGNKAQKSHAPILLMTGPPGAGKAVCLQVLCLELSFAVQEWTNNADLAADQFAIDNTVRIERSNVDTYFSQSQSFLFHNFLLRANKYQMLDIFRSATNSDHSFGQRKAVILVKDIPNLFLREPEHFHNILRKYCSSGRCPLVVIMSESNSSTSGIQKLFPKDIMKQLRVTNISFNPVAPTMMIKVLTRITSREAAQGAIKQPDVSVLENIVASSDGDLRSALNALQFACRLDTSDITNQCPLASKSQVKTPKSKRKSSKVKRTEMQVECIGAIGAKDKSVFLFHSVGKILYFKRSELNLSSQYESLPSHLKHHERDPLSLNPEEVVSQSHTSADYFNSFLHENCVEFLSSVEDLERVSQYFSDADYLASIWMAREELQSYAISVATRGYIHANTDMCRHNSIRKNQGWRPLHKSQWFNASKQACRNLTLAREIFKGYHWEPEVLCTEIIPYISLTNPTLHDPGQIRLIQELTQFSHPSGFIRNRLERLDERDVVDEDGLFDQNDVTESQNLLMETDKNRIQDEDNLPSSQSSIQKISNEDEDIVIEEFED